MFKYLKNEKGISLIMVIILLVLVGGLTAALLTAGIFNIGFGADEVDHAQAFYAADAGVEYTKNVLSSLVSEDQSKIEDYFENNNHKRYLDGEDINFTVELASTDDRKLTFISTGAVEYDNRLFDKQIEFAFELVSGFEYAVLINLLKQLDDDELEDYLDEHVWLRGAEDEFSMDRIMATNLGGFWEFIDEDYVKVSYTSGEAGDNGEGKPYVDEYLDFSREEVDKIEGGNFGPDYEGDDRVFFTPKDTEDLTIGDEFVIENLDGEMDFNKDNFVEYDEEYYQAIEDDVAIYYDIDRNEVSTLPPDDSIFWQEIDEDSTSGEWEQNREYSKGDIVTFNDIKYKADANISLAPNNSQFWNSVDLDEIGDYQFNDTTFDRSIIIVDGSLKTRGDVNFNDSLVLVRNLADIGGNTNLNRSLILAFADDYDEGDFSSHNENIFQTAGTPSIDLDMFTLPLGEEWHKDWDGIEEIFENIEDERGSILAGYQPLFWRQTK